MAVTPEFITDQDVAARRATQPMIASLLSLSVVLRAAPRATTPSMVAGATSAAPFDKDAFNSVVQTTYGRFDFVVARGRGCFGVSLVVPQHRLR